MFIRELSVNEFNDFSSKSPLNNYHQSINYALLKAENNYEYEIIGYCDENKVYAAALVLVKLIHGYLYAYIPEGFLIDYHDENLINNFTEALYNYYKKENIVFIKINPPLIVSEIDSKAHEKTATDNRKIVDILKNAGYTKLEDNLYFESILPRTNAIINLDDFSLEKTSKNTKNKIRKGIRKGLVLEQASSTKIDILNKFIKNKIRKKDFYYNDYYNIFQRDNEIDYFLVKIDYNKYILNSQISYEAAVKENEELGKRLITNPSDKIINKKLNSDKTVVAYKNDIANASKSLNKNETDYIAGALVIKHGDMATILISGYDKNFSDFAPNYFLYYKIINHYKGKLKRLDLNGITADFSKQNKFYGLNQFKIGFNPHIYEYIGEFDLVLNKHAYNHLLRKGYLEKEFDNN